MYESIFFFLLLRVFSLLFYSFFRGKKVFAEKVFGGGSGEVSIPVELKEYRLPAFFVYFFGKGNVGKELMGTDLSSAHEITHSMRYSLFEKNERE